MTTEAQQGREIVESMTAMPVERACTQAFLAEHDRMARDLEHERAEVKRLNGLHERCSTAVQQKDQDNLDLRHKHDEFKVKAEAKVAVLTEACKVFRYVARLHTQIFGDHSLDKQDAKLTAAGITL